MASLRVLSLLAVISALAVGVKVNPRTRTFPFKAKTSVAEIEIGRLNVSLHKDGVTGVIRIVAEVIGGIPKPATYLWTVQQPNGSIVYLQPGGQQGEQQASPIIINSRGNPSTTLTAVTPGKYNLDVYSEPNGGLNWCTGGAWSSLRTANPVQSGAIYGESITFTSNAKTSVPVRGNVKGPLYITAGVITVVAEVEGGNPKSNTYYWNVQQPDGRFIFMRPGQLQASNITINSRGNPSTTLTISEPSDIPRTFILVASSVTNGCEHWITSGYWTTTGRASR